MYQYIKQGPPAAKCFIYYHHDFILFQTFLFCKLALPVFCLAFCCLMVVIADECSLVQASLEVFFILAEKAVCDLVVLFE